MTGVMALLTKALHTAGDIPYLRIGVGAGYLVKLRSAGNKVQGFHNPGGVA